MNAWVTESAKVIAALLFIILMTFGFKTISNLIDTRDACVESKQETGLSYNEAMKVCL